MILLVPNMILNKLLPTKEYLGLILVPLILCTMPIMHLPSLIVLEDGIEKTNTKEIAQSIGGRV